MILAIVMANSNISAGCADKERILFSERLSTDLSRTELEYAASLHKAMKLNGVNPSRVEGVIMASVVPQLNKTLKNAARKATGCENILVVGPGVKTGLNILVEDPGKLGSDRVVMAVGALKDYQPPLMVLDMDTCTTISVLDKKGHCRGGVIAPGLRTGLNAMVRLTAQLPQVSLEEPRHTVGRNTLECIQSGVLYGHAAMVDGLIDRIEKETGEHYQLIATGEQATTIVPLCEHSIQIDETLYLKGLSEIYYRNV